MTTASLSGEALDRWLGEMRPRLHRYCARMLGSAFDGEDVVQEVLLKATHALPSSSDIASPQAWLFRIAHNTALDELRRRQRQADIHSELALTEAAESSTDGDAWVATDATLASLMALPVIQRSSVVLVDVLGHSPAETAEIVGASVPAVKSALHRGRVQLKSQADSAAPAMHDIPERERQRLREYAERFNARDFDALRNLLAEDVQLDLVNRLRLSGRKDVSEYFSRYQAKDGWRFAVGLAEGRPALIVTDPQDMNASDYVVLLGWASDRVATIRDFRFARYVTECLVLARV